MRAIEIGHIVAGPTAGLLLSEIGFDVIKVERPGSGDVARHLTGSSSGAFPFYNRNKKSITLDLKKKEAIEILLKLIESSDVIIDNLGFGALESLGLSYNSISKVNPKIIYLSIRGYGEGPYEGRKSLDFPIEVHSGLAYMTGLIDKPMRVGASIVDMGAAMFGVIAVLNALIEREKTQRGKKITIGMFETAMFFVGQHIASYQINEKELKPLNEEGFAWGIYDFFYTYDKKKIFIAVTTDDQWNKFCSIFSIDSRDKYPTNASRYSARAILIPEIQKILGQLELNNVIDLLNKGNISYAVLNTPWDLLNDEHASKKLVNEFFEGKVLRVPSSPLGSLVRSDPPTLGENTGEILEYLGYSNEQIDALKKAGVI